MQLRYHLYSYNVSLGLFVIGNRIILHEEYSLLGFMINSRV